MSMFHWFLSAVLICLTLQSTAANKSIQNLQAGSFIFHGIKQKQTHLYMLQFAAAFLKTPQFAFAINSLQSNTDNSTAGFDLSPEAVAVTGVILSWKRSAKKWVTVQINYFASIREDLYLGHQLVKISNGSSALYDVSFKTSSNDSKVIARLFLTGCSSDSMLFDCGVVARDLKSSSLTVAAYTTQSSSTDRYVSFSYIVFSPAAAGFSCFGGVFDVDKFVGLQAQNIQKGVYRTRNILYGFTMITFNADRVQNISSSVDKTMVLTFEAVNPTKFRLIYVALGKSSKQSCPNASLPYEWEDVCVGICPDNTYPIQYPNGGKACLTCQDKLNLTLKNGSCICKEGYLLDKTLNKCILGLSSTNPTSSGETKAEANTTSSAQNLAELYERLKMELASKLGPSSQETQKQQNVSRQSSNSDQNNNNYLPNATAQTSSTPTEGRNQTVINAIGSRLNDNLGNSSQLSQKSSDKQNNANLTAQEQNKTNGMSQKLPQIIAEITQTAQNSSVRLPTFLNQDSPCDSKSQTCTDPNAFLIERSCVCKPGYHKMNGLCSSIGSAETLLPIYIEQIQVGNHQDQNESCSCSTSRRPPPICLPPSFLGLSGKCQCPSNSVMFNGRCIECLFPAVFDYTQGKCINICRENQIFNQTRQKCVCRQGYGLGANGRCVRCNLGSFLVDGYCALCPDGKVYNEESKKCVCPSGTLQDFKGQCVSRCGEFEHFDQSSGSCVCDRGLGRVKGRCSLCPEGQVVDQNGECSPCIANQQIFAGKCRCKKNFVLRNQRCVSCDKINGGVELEGFCTRCPQGYQSEEGGCKCRNDFIVQNNQCLPCSQVKDAYIINGTCTKCQVGEQYVDGVCIKQLPAPPNYTLPSRAITLGTPPQCGNGLIEGLEECDDRNRMDGDGCSSTCATENGYSCRRMPSRCQKTSKSSSGNLGAPSINMAVSNSSQNSGSSMQRSTSVPQSTGSSKPENQVTLTEGNSSNTSKQTSPNSNQNNRQTAQSTSLSLEGDVKGNTNQVFIALNTQIQFDFSDQSEVQKFFKVAFDNVRPPTVFFNQHPAPKKNIFDCLLIFPSGVPTTPFTARFSYAKDGKTGSLSVPVDPLSISSPTRSRTQARKNIS